MSWRHRMTDESNESGSDTSVSVLSRNRRSVERRKRVPFGANSASYNSSSSNSNSSNYSDDGGDESVGTSYGEGCTDSGSDDERVNGRIGKNKSTFHHKSGRSSVSSNDASVEEGSDDDDDDESDSATSNEDSRTASKDGSERYHAKSLTMSRRVLDDEVDSCETPSDADISERSNREPAYATLVKNGNNFVRELILGVDDPSDSCSSAGSNHEVDNVYDTIDMISTVFSDYATESAERTSDFSNSSSSEDDDLDNGHTTLNMISDSFFRNAADSVNASSRDDTNTDYSSQEVNSNDSSSADNVSSTLFRTSTVSFDETSDLSSVSSHDEGDLDRGDINIAITLGNIFMNSIDQVDTCSSESSCTRSSHESIGDDSERDDDTSTENNSTSDDSDKRSYKDFVCEEKALKHTTDDIHDVPSDEVNCDVSVEGQNEKDTIPLDNFIVSTVDESGDEDFSKESDILRNTSANPVDTLDRGLDASCAQSTKRHNFAVKTINLGLVEGSVGTTTLDAALTSVTICDELGNLVNPVDVLDVLRKSSKDDPAKPSLKTLSETDTVVVHSAVGNDKSNGITDTFLIPLLNEIQTSDYIGHGNTIDEPQLESHVTQDDIAVTVVMKKFDDNDDDGGNVADDMSKSSMVAVRLEQVTTTLDRMADSVCIQNLDEIESSDNIGHGNEVDDTLHRLTITTVCVASTNRSQEINDDGIPNDVSNSSSVDYRLERATATFDRMADTKCIQNIDEIAPSDDIGHGNEVDDTLHRLTIITVDGVVDDISDCSTVDYRLERATATFDRMTDSVCIQTLDEIGPSENFGHENAVYCTPLEAHVTHQDIADTVVPENHFDGGIVDDTSEIISVDYRLERATATFDRMADNICIKNLDGTESSNCVGYGSTVDEALLESTGTQEDVADAVFAENYIDDVVDDLSKSSSVDYRLERATATFDRIADTNSIQSVKDIESSDDIGLGNEVDDTLHRLTIITVCVAGTNRCKELNDDGVPDDISNSSSVDYRLERATATFDRIADTNCIPNIDDIESSDDIGLGNAVDDTLHRLTIISVCVTGTNRCKELNDGVLDDISDCSTVDYRLERATATFDRITDSISIQNSNGDAVSDVGSTVKRVGERLQRATDTFHKITDTVPFHSLHDADDMSKGSAMDYRLERAIVTFDRITSTISSQNRSDDDVPGDVSSVSSVNERLELSTNTLDGIIQKMVIRDVNKVEILDKNRHEPLHLALNENDRVAVNNVIEEEIVVDVSDDSSHDSTANEIFQQSMAPMARFSFDIEDRSIHSTDISTPLDHFCPGLDPVGSIVLIHGERQEEQEKEFPNLISPEILVMVSRVLRPQGIKTMNHTVRPTKEEQRDDETLSVDTPTSSSGTIVLCDHVTFVTTDIHDECGSMTRTKSPLECMSLDHHDLALDTYWLLAAVAMINASGA